MRGQPVCGPVTVVDSELSCPIRGSELGRGENDLFAVFMVDGLFRRFSHECSVFTFLSQHHNMTRWSEALPR